MEGLHNLKDRICSFENLLEAYREASRDKRYRGEVLAFSFSLSENLLDIREDLLRMTYVVGPYREFYVRYPKPRLVMALGFRDRVVQWAIYRQINPYLEKRYIQHSYGCRKEKGTLAAAEQLLSWQQLVSRKPDADNWFFVKGDISKYFYRVDHAEALHTYRTVTDDEWFMWLITVIINNLKVPFGLPPGMKPDDCPRKDRLFEVGMPIGNLTSQETANLFLDRFDQYCKHVLRLHMYERYMDDFGAFVRGKENALEIAGKMKQFLHDELLLEMSAKSRIQRATAPIEYVGYILTPHGLRLRRKTTKHMKSALKCILAFYRDSEITYEKAMEKATCYLGMCKHGNSNNLKRWIMENIVQELNKEAIGREELPPRGGRFYYMQDNADGTVDVYLRPDILRTSARKDIAVLVVKGVKAQEGLEEDIRARFDAWCESGQIIYL